MRIDEILQKLYTDLDSWIKAQKGALSIAKDPWNVLELLVQGPQGFLVILHWAGDEQLGDQNQEPLADNNLEVIVSYNLGLQSKPDLALMKNEVNRPSLLKYVNDLRARILTYSFPADDTAQLPSYAGCEPVVLPEGVPLAAYKLRFKLQAKVETDQEYRGALES